MDPPPSSPRRRLAGLRPDALMGQGLSPAVGEGNPSRIAGLEILRPIGRGGMGTVSLARQVGLNREVALKQVASELAHDPLFLGRLEREARTMANLRHPHIVTVHHFEHLDDGGAAIVMEYVEGGNLRDKIERSPDGLPVPEAVRLFRQVASALSAAHASGVIHRDLKPENVLIGKDDSALVTDFGLAVPLLPETSRLTAAGTVVGTLDYLPPEQFHSADPDPRVDVYALGVVLYEMLTGTVPRGSFDPPNRLRHGIPKELSDATMRALKPNPEHRFPTVDAFLSAADGRPVGMSRRRVLAATAGSGILIAAGIWKFRPPANPVVPPPSTAPDVASDPGDWHDALASADVDSGRISGGWRRDGGLVESDDGIAILALEQQMPESYDVRTTFTRISGVHAVSVFFTANQSVGSVDIDGWGNGFSGVQSISGRDLRNTGGFDFRIENGRRYELFVQVRPESVRILIDGEEKSLTSIASQRLDVVSVWQWDPARNPAALALGSYQSPTRFENAEWRPVDHERP